MDQTVQTLRDLKSGIYNERSKDLLLALLIAIIGFTGSYLVLGKSIQDSEAIEGIAKLPDYSKINLGNLKDQTGFIEKNNYNYLEENLTVQGSMTVGSIIRISNLRFDSKNTYLVDFGNGRKHRMTSPVMTNRYNSPGFYLVQCYILVEKDWQLLAAETITIRKGEESELKGL